MLFDFKIELDILKKSKEPSILFETVKKIEYTEVSGENSQNNLDENFWQTINLFMV